MTDRLTEARAQLDEAVRWARPVREPPPMHYAICPLVAAVRGLVDEVTELRAEVAKLRAELDAQIAQEVSRG